jgi:F-type H+-transporting ATPase subunit delta
MSITTSSKRYAQAVFQVARERNNLDEWQLDLKKIAGLIQNPEFVSVIENPKIPFELKAKLTHEILGKINSLALNLSYLLIVKNKFKNAGQIAEEFDHFLNEYRGVSNAEVITAIPVDTSDIKNLTQRLETILGSKIAADFKVDPAILGGIIARVDGSLIDGSIRTKLEMLKKSMVGIRK